MKFGPTQYPIIQEYEHYLHKKNMADHTITAYLTSVHIYYTLYPEPTITNLKSYRSFLIKTYSPATINQRIHGINVFLRFLKTSHPGEYPEVESFCMRSLKMPSESYCDHIISNEDCQLLQDKLREEDQLFWYFVVRFLVTTGARVSELIQIKVEHLKLGYLDLYSKGGKVRRIYITDTLCGEALEWCQARKLKSGFLFTTSKGQRITTRGIHIRLKYFANRYGIDPDTVYPHSFRHRFAKNFLERCSDIALLADLMGHESIETTRIYLKKSSVEQRELLDEIITW